MRLRNGVVVAALAFLCGCGSAAVETGSDGAESGAFHSFVDDYFRAYFETNPTTATATGFHEYDSKLEDLSEPAIRHRQQRLRALQVQLDGIRHRSLPQEDQFDAAILDGQIKSELLDIEEIESWRRNPMLYAGLPGNAVDTIMKRDFAPARDRLRSVTARLEAVPRVIEALKANVVNPPREFTDLAIRMARGSVGFLKNDVTKWAESAAGDDRDLYASFENANRAATAAMESAVKYLSTDLLPRSQGKYAIGPDRFRRKLLYEEMVDTPLDQLLAVGEANLEKDYRDFVATAKQINPNVSPSEVMKSLSAKHPTEQSLIPSAEELLDTLRQFLVSKHIIQLPSDRRPIVTATPPYARSGTFASMDTPGAYEKVANEAFYYITPPEKDWTPRHKEEHLRAYAHPVIDLISIHEVYPGHFVQFLFERQFPTKTRKIIYCGTNVEGWAHYAEQMMIEEGFGGGDPRYKLAQLSEALVRDARYVVGMKLHIQGMTVQQGARVFVDKAFQEPANGFEEARRGAYNPTYLYYTLGKLQIYKLREDYKRARGSAYSLEKFHDEFVRQGGVPIRIMRQILLPGDRGSLL